MKKTILILMYLLVSNCFSQENIKHISWEEIERQEAISIEWVKKQGEEQVVQMGVSQAKVVELEWIKAFFPYLLPEQFYNRNLLLSCYPSFIEYRKVKSQSHFNKWKNCHLGIWRESLPPLLKQTFKELPPEK
jgi:hypothetical protein